MLFNSSEFLFVFLPVALVWILFARRRLAHVGDPLAHSGIPSVLRVVATGQRPDHRALHRHQFALASILLRLNQDEGSRRMSTAVLVAGDPFQCAIPWLL